jgi:hypothetical protein
MSLTEIKSSLIAKIQESNDKVLLNQLSEWLDSNDSKLVFPLNEIQKLKIEKSRTDVRAGNFKSQADLFNGLRNA